jgi:hypothetical protein
MAGNPDKQAKLKKKNNYSHFLGSVMLFYKRFPDRCLKILAKKTRNCQIVLQIKIKKCLISIISVISVIRGSDSFFHPFPRFFASDLLCFFFSSSLPRSHVQLEVI